MLTRYASAASSSAFVTVALLFLMHSLIALQPGTTVDSPGPIVIDVFPPDRRDRPVIVEELVPREKLTEQLDAPPRPVMTSDTSGTGVPMLQPAPPTTSGIPIFNSNMDGGLVALVRVAPVYPAKMLARGIEGYVLVQFDVTASGQVINPVVIESSHAGFESAALKTVLRFKYKPRVVGGVARESLGIESMLRFEIED